MKRSELAGVLSQPYSKQRGFGVEKVDKHGFENVWFVVPPKPPNAVTEKLDLPLVRDAILALQDRPSLETATEIQQTMAYLLVRREAVSSSRMEGTWSTVDEVLSPAKSEVGRSATASVRGYANALMLGAQAVTSDSLAALTPALLCDLHKRVMQKDPGFAGVAGRLRTLGQPGNVVQIGSFGRKEDPSIIRRRRDKYYVAWMKYSTGCPTNQSLRLATPAWEWLCPFAWRSVMRISKPYIRLATAMVVLAECCGRCRWWLQAGCPYISRVMSRQNVLSTARRCRRRRRNSSIVVLLSSFAARLLPVV